MRPLLCLLGRHQWNGCTCRLCGARREMGHQTQTGCRCRICGEEVHRFVEKDERSHRCVYCGLEQPHHLRAQTRWEDVGGWDEIGPWREAEIVVSVCEQCAFEADTWKLTGHITF